MLRISRTSVAFSISNRHRPLLHHMPLFSSTLTTM
uniref:Uncharacterized protein n=1 Tax=Arundo donax TaxID=35708 RepID=A0A0A8ZI07_ARUDO